VTFRQADPDHPGCEFSVLCAESWVSGNWDVLLINLKRDAEWQSSGKFTNFTINYYAKRVICIISQYVRHYLLNLRRREADEIAKEWHPRKSKLQGTKMGGVQDLRIRPAQRGRSKLCAAAHGLGR
jgi:hypothetical protein